MSDDTPVPVGVPQNGTKAVLAALGAFVSALTVGIAAANPDTTQEWVYVVLGALGAALVGGIPTYAIPNKAKAGARRERNEAGYGLVEICFAVLLLLIIIWVLFALFGGRG